MTNTLGIATDVALDGGGHEVTLSGGGAVRLFQVSTGATLRLKGLTLADGRATGTNGTLPQASPGGPGEGGAVLNQGTLLAENVRFLRHTATGGEGGPSGTVGLGVGGAGGPGQGGAICNLNGTVSLTNCHLVANRALGGGGAPTWAGMSRGGDAMGGALWSSGGLVQLVTCTLASNSTVAGQGVDATGFPCNGGSAQGGAVALAQGGLLLASCTFSQDTASGSFGGFARGGALAMANGTAAISHCWLQSERASGGGGFSRPAGQANGGEGSGGALFLGAGTATVTQCTLADCAALGGSTARVTAGGPARAGAIFNAATGQVVNCTLVTCQAVGGQAYREYPNSPPRQSGSAFGGGICNAGWLTLTHVTIASNVVASPTDGAIGGLAQGGNIYSTGGSVPLRNTILAGGGAGGDWFGATLVDEGNNLASDGSCPFTAPGSRRNTNPLLEPLANNGGPTPTMGLRLGSPAIDAANPAWCPATDQRGVPRPVGPSCDIGAYEASPIKCTRISGDSLQLRFVGAPGSPCTLQTTTDWILWTDGATQMAGPDGWVVFEVSVDGHASARFYRMVAR